MATSSIPNETNKSDSATAGKTRIVIAGYPKSGNTWLTRLVADLLDCPARGFLTPVNHVDNACEGENRSQNQIACYKSHHQWHELVDEQLIDAGTAVIYIVRDPRDVAVSAANFFRIAPGGWLGKRIQSIPKAAALIGAIGKKTHSEKQRIRRTVRAVLHGWDAVHHWCRISWRTHVRGFTDNGCLIIRFEDLLTDAEHECRRILNHLQIELSDEQISAAVQRQSFSARKTEFEQNGDHRKSKFLRSGRREQWREKLSSDQQQEFQTHVASELREFNYPP